MTGCDVELIRMARGDSAIELARELFKGKGGIDSCSLLVLPDDRLCREVRGHLAGKGGAVTTWVVTPWGLARELYTRMGLQAPVLDRKARQLLLRRVMERTQRTPLSLDEVPRPGMVRHISETIEELILHGVGPNEVKGAARTERAKALSQVQTAYMAELRGLGLIDTAEVPDLVLKALKGGCPLPPWDSAGFYMVRDQPALFAQLFSFIIASAPRTLIVDTVHGSAPSFIPPGAAVRELSGGGPARFEVPLEGSRMRGVIRSRGPMDSIIGQDWSEELRRAARRIKRTILEDGSSPAAMGIMLPSERKTDPWTFSVLREYGVPFDQGSRYRVLDVPVVRGLLDLFRSADQGFPREVLLPALSLPHYGLRDDEGRTFSPTELEQLTREAFVIGGGMDPVRSWTGPISMLSKDEGKGERLRDAAARALGPLERLLTSISDLNRSKRSVEEHLEGMLRVWGSLGALKLAEKDDDRSGPMDGASIASRAFSKLMDAFSTVRAHAVLAGMERSRLRDVLELLGSELSASWLEEGQGQGGIRVLSYDEGSGMAFKHLFVLGCNEGSMPPREGGFSLLSDMERRDLGLPPLNNRRQALERLCLALSSAEHPVIAMHRTEGGSPSLPSPFIEALQLEPLPDDGLPMSDQDVQRRFSELRDPLALALNGPNDTLDPRLRDGEALLSRSDKVMAGHIRASSEGRSRDKVLASAGLTGVIEDPALLKDLGERFGPLHIWSASRLERLRICPYSFLVRYVMGVQELDEVRPEVGPDKLGTIFHSAAESFYSNWRGRIAGRVLPAETAAAEAAMNEAVASIMASYSYSGPYWDAVRDRLIGDGRRPGMVRGFIESEALYRGAFGVSRTELKFGMPEDEGGHPAVRLGDIGSSGEMASFLFRGSMDRVDTVDLSTSKGFFIWDYKTGSNKEDNKSLQLPLYLIAASRLLEDQAPAGGGYYYVRRPGDIQRQIMLGAEVWDAHGPTREMLEAAARGSLSKMKDALDTALDLIASARNGSFPPKERCSDWYCRFGDVCRRGDL